MKSDAIMAKLLDAGISQIPELLLLFAENGLLDLPNLIEGASLDQTPLDRAIRRTLRTYLFPMRPAAAKVFQDEDRLGAELIFKRGGWGVIEHGRIECCSEGALPETFQSAAASYRLSDLVEILGMPTLTYPIDSVRSETRGQDMAPVIVVTSRIPQVSIDEMWVRLSALGRN